MKTVWPVRVQRSTLGRHVTQLLLLELRSNIGYVIGRLLNAALFIKPTREINFGQSFNLRLLSIFLHLST